MATIQRRNDSDSDSDSDDSGSEGEKVRSFARSPHTHTHTPHTHTWWLTRRNGYEQSTKKEPIIETSNLNRDNKTAQHIKASALSTTAKPELSRRER